MGLNLIKLSKIAIHFSVFYNLKLFARLIIISESAFYWFYTLLAFYVLRIFANIGLQYVRVPINIIMIMTNCNDYIIVLLETQILTVTLLKNCIYTTSIPNSQTNYRISSELLTLDLYQAKRQSNRCDCIKLFHRWCKHRHEMLVDV